MNDNAPTQGLTNLNILSALLKMSEIEDTTPEAKIEHQARLVFLTPGIIKPDNWDTLPFEEKKRRLDAIQSVIA